MTRAILNCEYLVQSGWTSEGDTVGFGHGLNSITLDVDVATATILRLSIEGDASLIKRLEYDYNLTGTDIWMWVDTENQPHQVLTGITETTNEDLTTHVSIDVDNVLDEEIEGLYTYINSYSSAQRIISNLRIYGENDELLNMDINVETFELPRDDWYDDQGRIYKDILIENLNAIESKLFELQGLDAFDIELPDISSIVFPDVDLTSDDSCIVNLRSFITLMHLTNYPIELQISGRKIRKLSYWDENYNYTTKTNVIVSDADEDNPYVYLDLTDEDIKATNNPTTAANGILLGVFENGIIRDIHEELNANLNLMSLLANMQTDTGYKEASVHNGVLFRNPNNNSRVVGFGDGESKSGNHGITFSDYGREV